MRENSLKRRISHNVSHKASLSCFSEVAVAFDCGLVLRSSNFHSAYLTLHGVSEVASGT